MWFVLASFIGYFVGRLTKLNIVITLKMPERGLK